MMEHRLENTTHQSSNKAWRFLCLLMTALLSACAFMPREGPTGDAVPVAHTLPLRFTAQDQSRWEVVALPGKLRTLFTLEKRHQKEALKAHAQSSASLLRQSLQIAPDQLGRLQFEWQVDQLIAGADMAVRETEDSPVRLILVFDGDRSRFSAKNALLSELTHGLTGEPLPYATLMYVWCNACPPETVITNPRTDRIRKWAVESGPARLGQWLTYRRDIRADFEKAFGEPPGTLLGIAIMTDTDNTRSSARAWYGTIQLD